MYALMVTGHRPQKLGLPYDTAQAEWEDIRSACRRVLRKAMTQHPEVVAISGMALGVDTVFAEEALALGIPLHAFVPCDNQDAMWFPSSKEHYRNLLNLATEITLCTQGPYHPQCMAIRNAMMVRSATTCLAIWNGYPGGTADAVEKFRKTGKRLVIYNPNLKQWKAEGGGLPEDSKQEK